MWKKGYMNKADIITPWFIQLQKKKNFQGLFKDKLQFLRTKIYIINQHSLTPF